MHRTSSEVCSGTPPLSVVILDPTPAHKIMRVPFNATCAVLLVLGSIPDHWARNVPYNATGQSGVGLCSEWPMANLMIRNGFYSISGTCIILVASVLRFASQLANKNDMHTSLHRLADRALVEQSCEDSPVVP